MYISTSELAYIAGIIDGEGNIGFYKTNATHYLPRVAAYNTDKRLIDWLYNKLGGHIYAKSQAINPNWKQGWEWRLTGKQNVINLLTQIRPFVIIKGEQIDLLLAHLNAATQSNSRASVEVSYALKELRGTTKRSAKNVALGLELQSSRN